MNAKQYMLRYARLTEKIRALQSDIIQYETIATNTTQRLDGMPHSRSPSDKVGSLSARIADLKCEKDQLITEAISEREEIRRAIDMVEDARYAKLLNIRYIELDDNGRLQTWEAVAKQMHMEPSWVRGGLHSQALEVIADIISLKA